MNRVKARNQKSALSGEWVGLEGSTGESTPLSNMTASPLSALLGRLRGLLLS